MKGWYGQSHRHYLAAKGIKTNRYMKNKYFMPSNYAIPHWLLNKLDSEKRNEAERMLYEDNMNIGDVAKYFDIKHPTIGRKLKPEVRWSDEQKIKYVQDLSKELGRAPVMADLPNDIDIPSRGGFSSGGWINLLNRAGIESSNVKEKQMLVVDKIEEYGQVPSSTKEVSSLHNKRPEIIEKRREHQREYLERPEIKEHMKDYYQQPKVKARQAEYRNRPEVKENIRKYHQQPEIKAKQAKYREYPEIREKLKEYKQRPDVKLKIRVKQKEYMERPEIKKRMKEWNEEYNKRPDVIERKRIYYQNYNAQKQEANK